MFGSASALRNRTKGIAAVAVRDFDGMMEEKDTVVFALQVAECDVVLVLQDRVCREDDQLNYPNSTRCPAM